MTNFTPYRNGNGTRVGSLLGWDPMRLLDDLVTWQPPGSEVVWSAFQRSPVHVEHSEDGATTITVDMPGVGPEDLELTFERGKLAITGKRGEHTYRYNLELEDTIDPDAIEAKLDKGVLSVHARKRPEVQPKKIPVMTPDKTLSSGGSK